mgnify:CR=1 FL=1
MRICLWLATGLGISYITPTGGARKWTGAGFLGTVEGLLLWPLLPESPGMYAAVVAAAAAVACWVCGRAEQALGRHDDSRIVLDEVVLQRGADMGEYQAEHGKVEAFMHLLEQVAQFLVLGEQVG